MSDRFRDPLVNVPDARDRYGLLWRGRVTRITAPWAWVEIPALAKGYDFGPCDLRGLGHDTNAADDSGHTHTVDSPTAVGDAVIVGFIGGDPEDPVILRRIQKE